MMNTFTTLSVHYKGNLIRNSKPTYIYWIYFLNSLITLYPTLSLVKGWYVREGMTTEQIIVSENNHCEYLLNVCYLKSPILGFGYNRQHRTRSLMKKLSLKWRANISISPTSICTTYIGAKWITQTSAIARVVVTSWGKQNCWLKMEAWNWILLTIIPRSCLRYTLLRNILFRLNVSLTSFSPLFKCDVSVAFLDWWNKPLPHFIILFLSEIQLFTFCYLSYNIRFTRARIFSVLFIIVYPLPETLSGTK